MIHITKGEDAKPIQVEPDTPLSLSDTSGGDILSPPTALKRQRGDFSSLSILRAPKFFTDTYISDQRERDLLLDNINCDSPLTVPVRTACCDDILVDGDRSRTKTVSPEDFVGDEDSYGGGDTDRIRSGIVTNDTINSDAKKACPTDDEGEPVFCIQDGDETEAGGCDEREFLVPRANYLLGSEVIGVRVKRGNISDLMEQYYNDRGRQLIHDEDKENRYTVSDNCDMKGGVGTLMNCCSVEIDNKNEIRVPTGSRMSDKPPRTESRPPADCYQTNDACAIENISVRGLARLLNDEPNSGVRKRKGMASGNSVYERESAAVNLMSMVGHGAPGSWRADRRGSSHLTGVGVSRSNMISTVGLWKRVGDQYRTKREGVNRRIGGSDVWEERDKQSHVNQELYDREGANIPDRGVPSESRVEPLFDGKGIRNIGVLGDKNTICDEKGVRNCKYRGGESKRTDQLAYTFTSPKNEASNSDIATVQNDQARNGRRSLPIDAMQSRQLGGESHDTDIRRVSEQGVHRSESEHNTKIRSASSSMVWDRNKSISSDDVYLCASYSRIGDEDDAKLRFWALNDIELVSPQRLNTPYERRRVSIISDSASYGEIYSGSPENLSELEAQVMDRDMYVSEVYEGCMQQPSSDDYIMGPYNDIAVINSERESGKCDQGVPDNISPTVDRCEEPITKCNTHIDSQQMSRNTPNVNIPVGYKTLSMSWEDDSSSSHSVGSINVTGLKSKYECLDRSLSCNSKPVTGSILTKHDGLDQQRIPYRFRNTFIAGPPECGRPWTRGIRGRFDDQNKVKKISTLNKSGTAIDNRIDQGGEVSSTYHMSAERTTGRTAKAKSSRIGKVGGTYTRPPMNQESILKRLVRNSRSNIDYEVDFDLNVPSVESDPAFDPIASNGEREGVVGHSVGTPRCDSNEPIDDVVSPAYGTVLVDNSTSICFVIPSTPLGAKCSDAGIAPTSLVTGDVDITKNDVVEDEEVNLWDDSSTDVAHTRPGSRMGTKDIYGRGPGDRMRSYTVKDMVWETPDSPVRPSQEGAGSRSNIGSAGVQAGTGGSDGLVDEGRSAEISVDDWGEASGGIAGNKSRDTNIPAMGEGVRGSMDDQSGHNQISEGNVADVEGNVADVEGDVADVECNVADVEVADDADIRVVNANTSGIHVPNCSNDEEHDLPIQSNIDVHTDDSSAVISREYLMSNQTKDRGKTNGGIDIDNGELEKVSAPRTDSSANPHSITDSCHITQQTYRARQPSPPSHSKGLSRPPSVPPRPSTSSHYTRPPSLPPPQKPYTYLKRTSKCVSPLSTPPSFDHVQSKIKVFWEKELSRLNNMNRESTDQSLGVGASCSMDVSNTYDNGISTPMIIPMIMGKDICIDDSGVSNVTLDGDSYRSSNSRIVDKTGCPRSNRYEGFRVRTDPPDIVTREISIAEDMEFPYAAANAAAVGGDEDLNCSQVDVNSAAANAIPSYVKVFIGMVEETLYEHESVRSHYMNKRAKHIGELKPFIDRLSSTEGNVYKNRIKKLELKLRRL